MPEKLTASLFEDLARNKRWEITTDWTTPQAADNPMLVIATPVIALTGFASSNNREEALRAGFSAHLAKPVEQPLLINAIDEALDRER